MTTLAGAPTGAVTDGTRRAITGLFRPTPQGLTGRWVFRGVLAFFVVLILASYAVPLVYQLRGERLLVVTSGSMAPEIQPGDAVVIRPVTSAAQLRVGQVVTFLPRRSTLLITHRIQALVPVERRDTVTDQPVLDALGNPVLDPYIRTKGDANDGDDADLTPASQVRGIVSEVHAGWGYPLGWAHSPVGRLLLFAPPLLMLIGAEVLSRIPAHVRARGLRRRSDDRDEERDDAPALV
ncbi:MAG: signal peptidase I [Candidatus Nanopelagicales bacterium]